MVSSGATTLSVLPAVSEGLALFRAPPAAPASALAGARAWARTRAGLQGEGRQARDLSC